MVIVDPDVCVLCGLCTGVCPPNAMELTPTRLEVLSNCTECGWCVPVLPRWGDLGWAPGQAAEAP